MNATGRSTGELPDVQASGILTANKVLGWATPLAVGLFLAVRLAVLDAECLNGDEVFSVNIARLDWPELWSATADDISHPPLFYTLLKLWIDLAGESLAWLRLLPTLLAILALIPLWGL